MSLEEEIEKTQSELGELITKPKLTPKLLGRPPFRFIHDIVSELTKETGFADGVYEGEELNSKAIKEKHAKIAYLDKLLRYLEENGEPCEARPNKIAAGAEAELTNHMLQAAARVARRMRDGGEPDAAAQQREEAEAEAARAAEAEKRRRRKEREEKEADAERARRDAEEAERRRLADEQRQADEAERRQQQQSRPSRSPPASRAFVSPEELGADGAHDTTRAILEPLIDRPKLTDKLLSRPPFRFIHDIFTALREETGFGEGLLPEELMVGKAIKDKDEKLRFLQLLLDLVGLHLGTFCEARPAKIAAGHESDRTNQLLQLLGVAAARRPDSREVVARIAGGEHAEPDGSHVASADRSRTGSPAASAPAPSPSPTPTPTPAAPEPVAPTTRPPPASSEQLPPAAAEEAAPGNHGEDDDPYGVAAPVAPARAQLVRPQTARRRPPKVKEGATAHSAVDDARGGGTSAPTGVMKEGEAGDSDDDDAEGKDGLEGGQDVFGLASAGPGMAGASSAAGRGRHTRDILRQQEAARKQQENERKDAEDGRGAGGGIRMGRIRQRSKAGGAGGGVLDLNELQHAIQRLCQSTHPLGQSMAYVREDMDDMRMELAQWQDDQQRRADALKAELRQTEDSLEPYRKRLRDVTEKCREVEARISAAKASITKNDRRIEHLLTMVVSK